jgi:hypothetical protein
MCAKGVWHIVGKLSTKATTLLQTSSQSKSEQRVIISQSCKSPNRGSFRTKSHSDVGAIGRHREYYMGEGGGFS